MDELFAEELADRSGVTAEQLRRLVELGIITPTPEGRFQRSDIQRIRVVDALAEAGFAPEQLSQLLTAGAYNLDWTSVVFPEPTAQTTTTLEQTAAAAGLPGGPGRTPLRRLGAPQASAQPGAPGRRRRAAAPGRPSPAWSRS